MISRKTCCHGFKVLKTKNWLMVAYESHKGTKFEIGQMLLKRVKWTIYLMHVDDKQGEIIQKKSIGELKHPD